MVCRHADITSAKRKREEDKAKKESMDKGISNYFTKGPVIAQPKAKVQLLHKMLKTTLLIGLARQNQRRWRLLSRITRRS
jgi:hypothetical protein